MKRQDSDTTFHPQNLVRHVQSAELGGHGAEQLQEAQGLLPRSRHWGSEAEGERWPKEQQPGSKVVCMCEQFKDTAEQELKQCFK